MSVKMFRTTLLGVCRVPSQPDTDPTTDMNCDDDSGVCLLPPTTRPPLENKVQDGKEQTDAVEAATTGGASALPHEQKKKDGEVEEEETQLLSLKGRVTVYSISGCMHCKRANALLHKLGLPVVEVNLELWPERREDMIRRTSQRSVPQIFFNEVRLFQPHCL